MANDTFLLPEYRGLKTFRNGFKDLPDSDTIQDQPELIKVVFAPDPETGLPRSALATIMSKDSSPEVAQAVKDSLLQAHSQRAGTANPDEAIISTKGRYQSDKDYQDGLVDFIYKENKK